MSHSPPQQYPTYSFIAAAPNPVGLGQHLTLNFWVDLPPPTASVQYGDRWQNITVTITKPDGSTETLGPFTSDDTGGTFAIYNPTALGNYTFQMHFPGQTLAGDNLSPSASALTKSFIGDYYQPSDSNIERITVQEEPAGYIPVNPLPESYWTRPIQSVNNAWYAISGNWLGLGVTTFGPSGLYNASGNYNPYTLAPNTGHIMWTKPGAVGGLMGGEFGGTEQSNYYSTSQYEPKYNPVILNGVLYYNEFPGASTNPTGLIAVDLKTGKTLWTSNTPLQNPSASYSFNGAQSYAGITSSTPTQGACTILKCGQVLNYVSPNQYGGFAYLWTFGTPAEVAKATNIQTGSMTWNMFDAMTGNYILSIVNGTSMTFTEDDSGDLITYFVNSTSNTLNMWNSTECIKQFSLKTGQNANIWEWRPPQGAIIPFSYGIEWSVPLPTNISGVPLPASLSIAQGIGGPIQINSGVVMLYALAPTGQTYYQSGYEIEAGFSTDTGKQLWIVNRTLTPFTRNFNNFSPNAGDGVYVEVTTATATMDGYSLYTGQKMWETKLPDSSPFDSNGGYQGVVANDIIYEWGYGGTIWAINLQTGKILWTTNTTTLSGDPGMETPYGVWPLWTYSVGTVADGKLYLAEGHQYSPPLFRGAHQLCLNITNGALVYDILGFDVTSGPAIADGIMTTFSAYDNQIYGFGKGPTSITVTAPQIGVTTSTPITIQGTITDISAGSLQDAVAANFPHGLPCVSDDSMSRFMEYVYMQQPKPANTTGVPIVLSVIDSNGNFRTIGTTTSNALGTYSYTWTPDISGDYTIYASFPGSESYYSSQAITAVHASEPAATPTSATPAPSPADLYFVPGIIAVIVAIIVVGAVTILALKKRP
jgi:PQQ enzyme repeat.